MTAAKNLGFSGTTRLRDYQNRRRSGKGNDNVTQENDSLVTKIPVGDSEAVTFRQISEWLGEKSNTISARYFPRIVMAHEGLKGYPALQSAPGKPTGYAAKCIAEYLDGDKNFEGFVTNLKSRYSKPLAAVDDNIVIAEVVDDDTVMTSGQGDRLQIAGKLALRKQQTEDDTDAVLSEVALAIQAYKAQDEDFFGSEEERLYDEAFQSKLASLGNELKRKAIKRKAELDAEKAFKELMADS